jgi:hypothetical protein
MNPSAKPQNTAEDEVIMFSGSNIPKNVDAEVIIWKCRLFKFEFRKQMSGDFPIADRRFFCQYHFDGKKFGSLNAHGFSRRIALFDKPPASVSPTKKKMSARNALAAISSQSDEEMDSESDEEPEKPVEIPSKSNTQKVLHCSIFLLH